MSQKLVPKKVRVCLDFAEEQVSFLNADTEDTIYTFPTASFTGDTIRPWLHVRGPGSELRLCD